MEIALKDGVRYILHKYDDERELEKAVIEHYREIFGENSFFLTPKKIETGAGVKAKTDGFVMSLDEPLWYILEVELSVHDLYNHVVSQITKFNQAIASAETRRKITKVFYNEINSSIEKKTTIEQKGIKELHKFLTELVDNEPIIAIFIDTKTKEIEEVCKKLLFKNIVIEFKTFVRVDAPAVHIHSFDTLKGVSMGFPHPVKPVEKITIKIPSRAYVEYNCIPVRTYKELFPNKKKEFTFETNLGQITTYMVSQNRIFKGLKKWFEQNGIKVGDKISIEILEPKKRYKLSKMM